MAANPVRANTARRRFARARRAAGYTQETLAAYLGVERSTVGRWELGETEPQPYIRPKLAEALSLSHEALEALLAFGVDQLDLFGQLDFQTGRRLVTLDPFPDGAKEEDVERRKLLEDLAALGIAISPFAQALEGIRTSVERTFESDYAHRVEHWEGIVNEYGYSYLANSPQQLVVDLAADMTTFRLITKDIDRDTPIYKDWCRVGSALAGLMAKVLSNLRQTREARHWWQTAQIASDISGDLKMRLWVRGERLIHGLYEQRSPHLLLRQSTNTLELAEGHICAGLLATSTARAQCLVLAGIPRAAETELLRSANIFEQLPSAVTADIHSAFGMGVDRLHYTETWVHAYSGNIVKTDQAAERALSCYPSTDYRTSAQVKLLQAFARTQAGDLTEGLRKARVTFEVLAPSHRTAMVTDLANRVLETIPPERQRRADVSAYRELLAVAGPQPQKAISP